MAEFVNDYQNIPDKNDVGNPSNQTKNEDKQSISPSLSDVDSLETSSTAFQKIIGHHLSTEIDNSSLERILEQELFGTTGRTVDHDPANDVGTKNSILPTQIVDPEASLPSNGVISDSASHSEEPVIEALKTTPLKTPADNPEVDDAKQEKQDVDKISTDTLKEPFANLKLPKAEFVGKFAPTQQTSLDNSTKNEPHTKIESAYFDLIQEKTPDQAEKPNEVVDDDLVSILAQSLNDRDQYAAPTFENNLAPNLQQSQSGSVDHRHQAAKPGFWTWRVMLGSIVMIGALTAGGTLVKTQGFPNIFKKMITTSQSSGNGITEPLLGSYSEENTTGDTTSPNTPIKSTALFETDFVRTPPVAKIEENTTKTIHDRIPTSEPDPKPIISKEPEKKNDATVENLTVKAKSVRTLLSSMQNAYSVSSLEKKPDLLAEITKMQGVISSLEQKINTLGSSQPLVQTAKLEISALTTKTPVPEKTMKPPVTQRDEVKPSGMSPAKMSAKPIPRDPKTVEKALASIPGILHLKPKTRKYLKVKLISGECLVPALSSVFLQVPVLVMRDMVRQLNDQC